MRATKPRSVIALAAVIPLLAAGPAGCGGGDDEEEPAPVGPTETTGEDEAAGEIDGGEAVRGPDVEGTEPRGSEDEPTPGTDPPE